jgi:hypothetical protein
LSTAAQPAAGFSPWLNIESARRLRIQSARTGQHTRRPEVVLFVNGLPVAVIELKNPADENATVWAALQQLPGRRHETQQAGPWVPRPPPS